MTFNEYVDKNKIKIPMSERMYLLMIENLYFHYIIGD
jgi:hypothetical protein